MRIFDALVGMLRSIKSQRASDAPCGSGVSRTAIAKLERVFADSKRSHAERLNAAEQLTQFGFRRIAIEPFNGVGEVSQRIGLNLLYAKDGGDQYKLFITAQLVAPYESGHPSPVWILLNADGLRIAAIVEAFPVNVQQAVLAVMAPDLNKAGERQTEFRDAAALINEALTQVAVEREAEL